MQPHRLHGANRLASNSLLEALVYAHTAVKTTQVTLEHKWLEKDYLNQIPQWSHPQEILDRYSEKIQFEVGSAANYVFKSWRI